MIQPTVVAPNPSVSCTKIGSTGNGAPIARKPQNTIIVWRTRKPREDGLDGPEAGDA